MIGFGLGFVIHMQLFDMQISGLICIDISIIFLALHLTKILKTVKQLYFINKFQLPVYLANLLLNCNYIVASIVLANLTLNMKIIVLMMLCIEMM